MIRTPQQWLTAFLTKGIPFLPPSFPITQVRWSLSVLYGRQARHSASTRSIYALLSTTNFSNIWLVTHRWSGSRQSPNVHLESAMFYTAARAYRCQHQHGLRQAVTREPEVCRIVDEWYCPTPCRSGRIHQCDIFKGDHTARDHTPRQQQ